MELIGTIYEALEDDEVIAALPDLIAQEIGSRSCTLQLFNAAFQLEGSWLNHFNGPLYDFYVENDMHLYDVWTNTNLNVIGLNKANRHTDFLPIEEFCESFFYNEVIRRFGDDSAYCLGFISSRADDGFVVFGMQNALTDVDFTDEQVAIVESLRPHITRMATLRRNMTLRARLASGARVGIDAIEDAYLVVRGNRRIFFANSSAEALLEDRGLLKSCGGNLFLTDESNDKRLDQAQCEVAANRVNSHASFLAHDTSGNPWRFTVAPKSFDGETMLLLWIDRGQVAKSASETLRQIYGLTASELPVLMSISEGLSAREIADRQGITIATVRTHLQHIYQKTDVNKASQLATLVATLPKI